jgi:hypothetical protein
MLLIDYLLEHPGASFSLTASSVSRIVYICFKKTQKTQFILDQNKSPASQIFVSVVIKVSGYSGCLTMIVRLSLAFPYCILHVRFQGQTMGH